MQGFPVLRPTHFRQIRLAGECQDTGHMILRRFEDQSALQLGFGSFDELRGVCFPLHMKVAWTRFWTSGSKALKIDAYGLSLSRSF